MAVIRGGFFENTDYKAEDFALSHEAMITQGVVADVTEDTKDALLVLPGEDMKILVNPGYCWIAGGVGLFFGCAPATVQLSVSSADATYTRIDRVIVRKDSNNKIFSIEVLKGIASSAPEAPALTRNGTIDEICLAEITVPAGTIEITQSMIVDKRHDTSVCGISQSALNKIDTSKVFAGYEAQWAELMGQLAADPAGNLQLQIGLLSNLKTENKENLVEAINESMHIIDGIPVDLKGIYNTQVIGYDETQGKLVPMINVARTETAVPANEIPVPWEWDLVNVPPWMGVGETSIDRPSIINTSTASTTKDDIIFSVKSTKSYLISEYTSMVYKVTMAYMELNTSTVELSKDANFNTIDASFSVSFGTDRTVNISNLTGKYYWRYNFSGRSLGTAYSPNSVYVSLQQLKFSQGG